MSKALKVDVSEKEHDQMTLTGINGETKKESSSKSLLCFIIPIICSLVAIAISIVSICLVCTRRSASSTISIPVQDEMKFNITCVDCNEYNSPDQKYFLDQLTRYTNQTSEMCCAQNNSQASALLALLMSNEKQELPGVLNPDNFSMSQASFHKKLYNSTSLDDRVHYPLFDPLQSYNLMFATNQNYPLLEHNVNIEFMASGTKIKQSGLYMIYCSVHFKPDSPEPCKTFTEQTFSLNITKTGNGNTALLLSAAHTCCDDCIRNQETAFTAGVFLLQENDFLKVDVSADGLVNYRPESTFFGLTLLYNG